MRIKKLKRPSILSKEAAQRLKYIFSCAAMMRLRVYNHYQAQNEHIDALLYMDNRTVASAILTVSQHHSTRQGNLGLLMEIYKTLIPFYEATKQFCQVSSIEINPFKDNCLYDETDYTQGLIATRLHDYETAMLAYQKVLLADSQNRNALYQLGFIYVFLGEGRKAINYFDRTLKIAEERNHLLEIASVLVNLGVTYLRLGDAQKSVAFFERALIIQVSHYPNWDHPDMATVLDNLGNAYSDLGDRLAAKAALENALRIREKYYGKNHVKVAFVLDHLGVIYFKLGETVKSKDYLQRARSIIEEHYGPWHSATGTLFTNLGITYFQLQDMLTSKDLLERAWRILAKHYGEDHIETAEALANLGSVYRNLGDIRGMILLEYALSIQENYYAGDHILMAKNLTNLGLAYQEQGNIVRSTDFLERALRIKQRFYEQSNPEIAQTLEYLGIVDSEAGDMERLKNSKNRLQQALIINEKYYGDNHIKTAEVLAHLSGTCFKLGSTRESEEFLERAIEIAEKWFDAHSVEVVPIFIQISDTYRELGNVQRGLFFLERARTLVETHYGSYHFELARIFFQLGMGCRRLKGEENLNASKYYFEQALIVGEKYYLCHPIQNMRVLIGLGDVCLELGKMAASENYVKRALKITESNPSINQLETADIDLLLGGICGKLKELQDSKKYLEKACVIREKYYGTHHVKTAEVWSRLGATLGQLGKLEDLWNSNTLLQRALVVMEEYYGTDSIKVAKVLVNLGVTCFNLGGVEYLRMSRRYYERAYRIIRREHDFTDLLSILNGLGATYFRLGNILGSVNYLTQALRFQEERYGYVSNPDVQLIKRNLSVISEALPFAKDHTEYRNNSMIILLDRIFENRTDLMIFEPVNISARFRKKFIEDLEHCRGLQRLTFLQSSEFIKKVLIPLHRGDFYWAGLALNFIMQAGDLKLTIHYWGPLDDWIIEDISQTLKEIFQIEIREQDILLPLAHISYSKENSGPFVIAAFEHWVKDDMLVMDHIDLFSQRKKYAAILDGEYRIDEKPSMTDEARSVDQTSTLGVLPSVSAERKWGVEAKVVKADWYGLDGDSRSIAHLVAPTSITALQEGCGLLCVQPSASRLITSLSLIRWLQEKLEAQGVPVPMVGLISMGLGALSRSHIGFNLFIGDIWVIFDPYGSESILKREQAYRDIKAVCEQEQKPRLKRVILFRNRLQYDALESSCGAISTAVAIKLFNRGFEAVHQWVTSQESKSVVKENIFYEERDAESLLATGTDPISILVKNKSPSSAYDTAVAAMKQQHRQQWEADSESKPSRIQHIFQRWVSETDCNRWGFEQIFSKDTEFPQLVKELILSISAKGSSLTKTFPAFLIRMLSEKIKKNKRNQR